MLFALYTFPFTSELGDRRGSVMKQFLRLPESPLAVTHHQRDIFDRWYSMNFCEGAWEAGRQL